MLFISESGKLWFCC